MHIFYIIRSAAPPGPVRIDICTSLCYFLHMINSLFSGRKRRSGRFHFMSRKVTIQDIADAIGVSRNTVSKAINNNEGLADVTREKILNKAVEMGYKQFSYVQAMYQAQAARQETGDEPQSQREIALLTPFYFSNSHFASTMLDRLQKELAQMGYRLNTHIIRAEEIRERRLPFTFIPEQASAVICIEMFDWEYSLMLCDLGLPILFVDGPVGANGRVLPADKLCMDNMSELSRLMNLMIGKGIRKIGFLGDYMHCESFFERYLAFRSTMLLAGIPVEDRFIIPKNDILELYQGLEALDELPELFICANDFVAYDALQSLRKLGKSVPEDVMLAGFDNAPESRMVVPALTTIHIHTQVMAFSAAQLLISRIREPSLDFRKVYTETTLVPRESTGTLLSDEAQS